MVRLSSPPHLFLRLVLGLSLAAFPLTGQAATKKGTSSSKSSSSSKSTAKKTEDDEPPPKRAAPKKRPADADTDDKNTPDTDSPAKKPKPAPKPEDSTPSPGPADQRPRAPSATLETSDLLEFEAQPPRVQQIITAALALTKLNLTYTYGSAEPARGGMDCSGTIYHTLREQGFAEVPRDSSEQYVWIRKAGGFQAVVSTSADSFEFDALRPGDLMFWTGTYSVAREIPVSHVMLYLGREKKTKQRVMFGASDGRSYHGVQRWGVSVFDFKMPKQEGTGASKVDFIGYGPIPGLRSAAGEVAATEPPKPEPEKEKSEEPEKPAAKKPTPSSSAKSTSKSPVSSSRSSSKSKKR